MNKNHNQLLTEDENIELGGYLRRVHYDGKTLSKTVFSRYNQLLEKKAKEDYINYFESDEYPEFEEMKERLKSKIIRDLFP